MDGSLRAVRFPFTPTVPTSTREAINLQDTQTHLPDDPPSTACQNCGRMARIGRAFTFRPRQAGPDDATVKCILCAPRHGPMLRRSAVVAVVVGTILTLLNQGDGLLTGQWNNALYWKIPLTYCVPFLVATYGALTAARR